MIPDYVSTPGYWITAVILATAGYAVTDLVLGYHQTGRGLRGFLWDHAAVLPGVPPRRVWPSTAYRCSVCNREHTPERGPAIVTHRGVGMACEASILPPGDRAEPEAQPWS